MRKLNIILKDKIAEVWINDYTRALIIPLENNVKLISLDLYFEKWKFPVEEEVSLEKSKLVYYKPRTPLRLKKFKVYKLEFIGHVRGEVNETVSVRLWCSKENVEREDIIQIYEILLEEYFK